MTSLQRYSLAAIFSFALLFQYCYRLNGTGVLGPDEPRYTAIGMAMAERGDWITPRLWGSPWFEKPALLYWMAAAGTKSGLSEDLAGRLPVVLLSLAFLAAWFLLLRDEFGARAAAIATVTLATSALWFAYSGLCLTDIPMAAFFSLGLALVLRLMRTPEPKLLWLALGASLGLSVLAKGGVPVVLSLPLLWFLRKHWRSWWIAALAVVVVAGPWYALVTLRNGWAFVNVFFLQQQFSRLYSESLQHVQPVYFYLPVVAGAMFPWTPLAFAIRPAEWRKDRRLLCLAAVVLFGLLFFSISKNKLTGYVIPLMPALFALIAVHIANRRTPLGRGFYIACAVLIAAMPLAGRLVPAMLTGSRITHTAELATAILPITAGMLVLILTPLVVGTFARREVAGGLLALCFAVAVVELKAGTYPILDNEASPRGFWREIAGKSDQVCDAGLHRAWEYGLAFYRGNPIPLCDQMPQPFHLVQSGRHRPEVIPAQSSAPSVTSAGRK